MLRIIYNLCQDVSGSMDIKYENGKDNWESWSVWYTEEKSEFHEQKIRNAQCKLKGELIKEKDRTRHLK